MPLNGNPMYPAMDVILIINPPLFSLITGNVFFIISIGPKKFVLNRDSISLILDSTLKEVIGGDAVSGIVILNNDGSESNLPVEGVFIAIGHTPNTDIFKDKLDMKDGYIVTKTGFDIGSTATSVSGVFAAGDVADYNYRQAVTSAGFGCMAALDAEHYLSNLD